MEEIFFVRFSLQQSCGIFGENQFSCDDIIKETDEQVAQYVEECRVWQEKQAQELKKRYTDINKLAGKKTLYVGDSITVDRLGYRGITTAAANLDAHSMAVSGATSVDMLRSIYGETLKSNPEVVSVLIGVNDAFFVGAEEKINLISKDEYHRNLSGIINICKDSGALVMLITIPDVGKCSDKIKKNDNKNIEEYNNIIRDVAHNTGVMLIDLNSEHKLRGVEEMLEPDGVHLNKYGQIMLADLWLKTLLDNTDN